MDLGTVGGLVTVTFLICAAILLGSSLLLFVDAPSIVVVIFGTAAVMFIMFPAAAVKEATVAVRAAFKDDPIDYEATVKLLEELSNRARREGLLSLEEAAENAEDEFLRRGLRMMADGHEAGTIEGVLFDEIEKIGERHKKSASVWMGVGDMAPAMGMIGTLIGLVQMLQNMSDPAAIGPAMAVALLTTFYGSILANLIGIPLSNKMLERSGAEVAHKELMAHGLISILNGENPRFMVERLNATLPPSMRLEVAA